MNAYIKHKQTQTQKTNLWLAKGKGEGEGQMRDVGLTDTNSNLYIKQISNQNILYSTENYTHYLMITYQGWVHLLSWVHQNNNDKQKNHWWKRLEPTRKDPLQLKTKEGTTSGWEGQVDLQYSQVPYPQVDIHKLENNSTAEVLPQEYEVWDHVRPPILGVLYQEDEPSEHLFGFEGQWGLILEGTRALGKIQTSLVKGAHKISHVPGSQN